MTSLTHTHISATAPAVSIVRAMRVGSRNAARTTVNPLALAGRYVH